MVYNMWKDFVLKKNKKNLSTGPVLVALENYVSFFYQNAVSTPKGAFKHHITHI